MTMEERIGGGWMNWCIPAGRISGVRVGIHWTFPLFLLFEAYDLFMKPELSTRYGWAMIVTMLLLFVVILAHEFGHVFAARREGLDTERVMLWPLGGLAYIAGEATGKREVRIAAAGPGVSAAFLFLWVPVIALLGVRVEPSLFSPFSWWPIPGLSYADAPFVTLVAYLLFKINLVVTLVNLLPAFPLDGGRMLRGFLYPRHGPFRSTYLVTSISYVLTVALVIIAFIQKDSFLVFFALFVGLTAWSVRRQTRLIEAETALERGVFGFRVDPAEGWRDSGWEQSQREADRKQEKARTLEEKEQRELRKRIEEEKRLDDEVDGLLDKISREGITSLTRKEKSFLEKASRRKRGPK